MQPTDSPPSSSTSQMCTECTEPLSNLPARVSSSESPFLLLKTQLLRWREPSWDHGPDHKTAKYQELENALSCFRSANSDTAPGPHTSFCHYNISLTDWALWKLSTDSDLPYNLTLVPSRKY